MDRRASSPGVVPRSRLDLLFVVCGPASLQMGRSYATVGAAPGPLPFHTDSR